MADKSKSYRVVGQQPVLDHQPGEKFDAKLDEAHEEFLVGIGAIEVVSSSDSKSS